jgi:tRNA(fMet)-specific endonuclease VapC
VPPALVDTDVLSLFLRGEPAVVKRVGDYLSEHATLNLSIITYYEILSGLAYRDASKQRERFLELVRYNTVLPLTMRACDIAADLYARLRKQGRPVDDIDLLIAGIALEHDFAIATHNISHFERIAELTVDDWTRGPTAG